MNNTAVKQIRQRLIKDKLDGLLLNKGANVAYLSGFRGEGQLLLTPERQILLTDFRFFEQARKETQACQIYQRQSYRSQEEIILRLVKRLSLKRIGFEARALSYKAYAGLKTLLGPIKLIPTVDIVEQLRAIKSPEEIKLLKKAALLASQAMTFARQIIKPGKTEKEIADRLKYMMQKLGAEDSAFDIIVASGERSALPHANVSRETIKDNQLVLIDLGCRFAGYNSDLTRVTFLGKISHKIKRIYAVVLRAQQEAIKAIRAGIEIAQLDRIARQHIAKEGWGKFFGHALGHGIGKEVHELPFISPKNHCRLKSGMVFTIEPGVYIPGVAGVRIEDTVLVTEQGCEVLTK